MAQNSYQIKLASIDFIRSYNFVRSKLSTSKGLKLSHTEYTKRKKYLRTSRHSRKANLIK
jgi:hypothetical protein